MNGMVAQRVSSLKVLRAENLRELAGCSGLCLSVFLPPFLPGEKGRDAASTMLRNFAQQAESKLASFGADKTHITALVEPISQLAADPQITEGFHWSRAILRSPEVFEEFVLRTPVEGEVTVASRFQLLPLVAEAELPAEYYLIKISKKHATLERAGLRAEPVMLPETAQTVDDFLAFDIPDHDRENRMTAGSTRQVRFGTGSERETQQAYLADYYRHVDHAIASILRPRNAVAVLVGVEEDIALYRSVSTATDLLVDSIRRSAADGGSGASAVSGDELLTRALALIRSARLMRNEEARAAVRERLAPARFSEDAHTIANMAALGRVARLYVSEDARTANLNDAVIETLTHGGDVHAIPAGQNAAAALRY